MLKRFLRADRGNFAVITAIAIVPTMAAVVGAVDLVTIVNKASEVQNALDAAGLAAATKYLAGSPEQQIPQLAEEHFRANIGSDDKLSASFVFSRPSSGGIGQDAVTATYFALASDLTYQGMLAASDLLEAHRETLVKVSAGKPACLLALNKTASAAVKIQGTTNVNMPGCVVAANSRAEDAVSRGGTAKLAAECVSSAGGTVGIASNSNVKLACGSPWEQQYPTTDPLAGLVPPDTICNSNVPGTKEKTLSPGTYCNKSATGNITLEPGTYVFRGTDIKLGGNGSLTGTGVTIFLLDGASINFSANEVVKLSPPETGPYTGITIYQEWGNTQDLTMLGGAGTVINGFVYAPSARIQFAGNSDTNGTPECIRVVGDTIEMTGTSAIALDCEKELGGKKMYAARYATIMR